MLSTISILYPLCLGDFIIQWTYLNLSIVDGGDTRQSMFISTLEGGPAWLFILDDCFYYGVFLVTDILLVSEIFADMYIIDAKKPLDVSIDMEMLSNLGHVVKNGIDSISVLFGRMR